MALEKPGWTARDLWAGTARHYRACGSLMTRLEQTAAQPIGPFTGAGTAHSREVAVTSAAVSGPGAGHGVRAGRAVPTKRAMPTKRAVPTKRATVYTVDSCTFDGQCVLNGHCVPNGHCERNTPLSTV